MSLSLISPAKINLFLQVEKKRPDGYHDLASLFQTISLHDKISITLSEKDTFTSSDPNIPLDGSNLIIKAREAFRNITGLKFNVSIAIQKNIPIEAGLGGGSSNAATILFGLNNLLLNPLTLNELQEIGSKIGSDVPFFLSEGTALCRGRGELIEELKPLKPESLYIVKPAYGLKTPLVFQNLDIETCTKCDLNEVIRSFYEGHPIYFNDLEKPAFKLRPELETLKNSLKSYGFEAVLMSGSGTSFFCINDTINIDNHDFTFISRASFLNRKKKKWYEIEKMLH